MKRKLIASMLGVSAAVTMAHAQGYVLLNNYSMNYSAAISGYLGSPVKYGVGSGGTVGNAVVGGFNLELAYDIGTTSDTATPSGGPAGTLNASLTETGTTGIIGSGAGQLPGYGLYGLTTIPGYTAGNVTLEFLAFNGSSYATSSIRGHSEAVTFASIATGQAPPTQLSGFSSSGFYVVGAVPEPTTMALVGLGAAGMMFFRRRNQA